MKCTSLLCRISASVALAGVAGRRRRRCTRSKRFRSSSARWTATASPSPIFAPKTSTSSSTAHVCKTTKFEEINWPVKLTLMVDNGPVHTDALRQLREALRLFIAELPTDMEVSVISIDPAPRLIYSPGNDRVKLLSSLDLLIPDQRRAEVHRRAVGSRRSHQQGQDRQEQGKGELLPRLHDGRQRRASKAATRATTR